MSGVAGSIEVADLAVWWDGPTGRARALDGLDLEIRAGSFVAIVGPSGCGKSTLLRVLAGLLRPDRGIARVGGEEVTGVARRCAWMPQRDALLPWRRVLANAVLGAEVAGEPMGPVRARALELLDRFGLEGLAEAWPDELSGGMRQRVAVLRTFLHPAPVLLLDEPFGALDALTRRQMQSWLADVWVGTGSGDGRTVLLVTHDVEEALLLADRVVVLSAAPGRVVADLAVDHPRPRSAELVSDPVFVAQRLELLGALGVGPGPGAGPVSDRLPRAPH